LSIIDAHYHFYERPGWNYEAAEYLDDAASGHRIVASVHMQALTRYRPDGDEALRPVGETAYVRLVADRHQGSRTEPARGIVSHANLVLGNDVARMLEAHRQAGGGRIKGGVVRIGTYEGRRDEVFATWRKHIRELGRPPSVYIKLGGLGMRINGFDFETLPQSPSSRLLADTWKP
jgi:predicted TIM-barrel fold metal-dependent hydrolase